ncbi:MAG: tetratricopeptide repeat protein [Rhodospirillaceae bacterium]|nr:tetratricopeptide repeat protein [Rhodospirillaceae bacterium]
MTRRFSAVLTVALLMSASPAALAADASPPPAARAPTPPAGPNAPPSASSKVGLAAAYLAGRHAEANGDTGKAVNFLNAARDLDPSNSRLIEDSYFLSAQMGDFAQAVPAAKRAYDANPRRGLAPVILAADAYKKKDYQTAWGYIEKIPAQSVNSFALPVLRAWGAAPIKPAETALAELTLLKNFQDTAKLVDLMGGMLNEHYGLKDAAGANYDTLAANIETERTPVLRIVVKGYHRLGKTTQAKAVLQRFEKAHGPSPMLEAMNAMLAQPAAKITPQEGMAEALFASAELLLQTEPNPARMQIATAYAQTAIHVNPQLTVARAFIGSAFTARGRFEEANATLSAIPKGEPGALEARMQVASNLTQMNRSDEALGLLREILKDRPTWADAHIAIGDLFRREEKFGDAVAEYSAALRLRPAGAEENWAIYYTRGISYERTKDWNNAEKDFKKALEIKPGEPSVLNYLGYSYLDRGVNLKEARRLIELAYTKRPDDGYIIDSLGWMLFTLGEYDKAVVHLEKAVEAAPADATINEHFGDALWKVGRRVEARYQWQRALILDVEDAQRAAITKKLEQGLASK